MHKKSILSFVILALSTHWFITAACEESTESAAHSQAIAQEKQCLLCHQIIDFRTPMIASHCAHVEGLEGDVERWHIFHRACVQNWQAGLHPDSRETAPYCAHCETSLAQELNSMASLSPLFTLLSSE